MKKMVALFVALLFATGAAGLAVAADDKKPGDTKAPAAETKTPQAKKMASKSAHGTVKSAAADSVVVAGKEKGKEVEWAFGVDAKTTVKRAGKSATATDLQAGDSVRVKYAEQDGKMIAETITAKAGGKKAAANPCSPKNPCAAKK